MISDNEDSPASVKTRLRKAGSTSLLVSLPKMRLNTKSTLGSSNSMSSISVSRFIFIITNFLFTYAEHDKNNQPNIELYYPTFNVYAIPAMRNVSPSFSSYALYGVIASSFNVVPLREPISLIVQQLSESSNST